MSATKKPRLEASALETTPELEALVLALHEIGAVKVAPAAPATPCASESPAISTLRARVSRWHSRTPRTAVLRNPVCARAANAAGHCGIAVGFFQMKGRGGLFLSEPSFEEAGIASSKVESCKCVFKCDFARAVGIALRERHPLSQ